MTAPFTLSQPLVPVPPPNGAPPGVDAGVLGIEARHTWYGELGPVMLNYLWDDAGARVVLSRAGQSVRTGRVGAAALYVLTRVTGIHSRAESDDNRAQLTARPGEVIYPSEVRGRTITYEGTVYGATLADLRRAETQLRRATAGTYSGWMVVEPHPTYGTVPWAYFARCTQLDLPDEQSATPTASRGPHQRPFSAAFRQHDPRFYVWQQRQALGLAAGGAGSTVTNQGSAPTDPTLTLHPPTGTALSGPVRLHNDTNGALLDLDPAIGGSGITLNILTGVNGHVTIDFYNRTIQNETGFSLLRCLNQQASTWWDEGIMGLVPGDNVLRLETPSTGTFDASWLDASW